MSKKKNKFDLTRLVHHGLLQDGETLFFVSDPGSNCLIKKMPNHEYKLQVGEEIYTVHAIASKFLGTEPPDHACRWLRTEGGKSLYELWQLDLEEQAA